MEDDHEASDDLELCAWCPGHAGSGSNPNPRSEPTPDPGIQWSVFRSVADGAAILVSGTRLPTLFPGQPVAKFPAPSGDNKDNKKDLRNASCQKTPHARCTRCNMTSVAARPRCPAEVTA